MSKDSLSSPQKAQVDGLFDTIRLLLTQSRQQMIQAVNSAMVQTYWQIGCLIVEDEQQGQSRAEYGKGVLQALSSSLTKEFGKGFDVRNLRNMRNFYRIENDRITERLSVLKVNFQDLTNEIKVLRQQLLMNTFRAKIDKKFKG